MPYVLSNTDQCMEFVRTTMPWDDMQCMQMPHQMSLQQNRLYVYDTK